METAVPTYVTTDRKMAPGANTSPGLRSWSIVTMVICKKQREIVWYLFYEKRHYFTCSSTNYTQCFVGMTVASWSLGTWEQGYTVSILIKLPPPTPNGLPPLALTYKEESKVSQLCTLAVCCFTII